MPTNPPSFQEWWRLRQGPAWRYLTASDIGDRLADHRAADPLTREVAHYLRLIRHGGHFLLAARNAFPRIARTFELQNNQPLVDDWRLMLLGGLDDAEILSRTGVARGDLRNWRSIFFDVDVTQDRPRWPIAQIVDREVAGGNRRLASRLYLAHCGGPAMARRLLDGPGMVPDGPREYARYVRTEAQIAAAGLFLSPAEGRADMERFLKLALELDLQEQKLKLAEAQLAARVANDERRHELAQRRVRVAELKAEAAVSKAAAHPKSPADKVAKDRELKSWQRDQLAAVELREQAEMQARIEQSPLFQLKWSQSQYPVTPQVSQVADAAICPTSTVPPRTPSRDTTKRAIPSPSLVRAFAEMPNSQPSVADPTPSLAP